MNDHTVHREKAYGRPAGQDLDPPKEVLKELSLEECSVFKGKAMGVIAELLERTPGDKAEALCEFMRREVNERVGRSKAPGGGRDWNDAMNTFDGVFMFSPEMKIKTGSDVGIVMKSLTSTKMSNIKERRVLVQVYFAARRKIFPEAPFPK